MGKPTGGFHKRFLVGTFYYMAPVSHLLYTLLATECPPSLQDVRLSNAACALSPRPFILRSVDMLSGRPLVACSSNCQSDRPGALALLRLDEDHLSLTVIISPGYVQEVLKKEVATTKADVYSYGITIKYAQTAFYL